MTKQQRTKILYNSPIGPLYDRAKNEAVKDTEGKELRETRDKAYEELKNLLDETHFRWNKYLAHQREIFYLKGFADGESAAKAKSTEERVDEILSVLRKELLRENE